MDVALCFRAHYTHSRTCTNITRNRHQFRKMALLRVSKSQFPIHNGRTAVANRPFGRRKGQWVDFIFFPRRLIFYVAFRSFLLLFFSLFSFLEIQTRSRAIKHFVDVLRPSFPICFRNVPRIKREQYFFFQFGNVECFWIF